MPVVYKSGRKHGAADCLSREPVKLAPERTGNNDGVDDVFLSAVNISDIAALQRKHFELRALIEHLEGQGNVVPRVFVGVLTVFAVCQGVLYK